MGHLDQVQELRSTSETGQLIRINLGTVEHRNDDPALEASPDSAEIRIVDSVLDWIFVAGLPFPSQKLDSERFCQVGQGSIIGCDYRAT